MKAYPNPVANQFTVEASATTAGPAQLEVYAPTGALLLKRATQLVPGANAFNISSVDWPIGVYSVRITDGNTERRVKVVKVR